MTVVIVQGLIKTSHNSKTQKLLKVNLEVGIASTQCLLCCGLINKACKLSKACDTSFAMWKAVLQISHGLLINHKLLLLSLLRQHAYKNLLICT